MRFLVTGASGFIGCPIVFRLAECYGHENVQLIVPGVDRHPNEKLRRKDLVDAGFDILVHDIIEDDLDIESVKPFNVLFHLAAFVETETKSTRVRVNDRGTERLLRALAPLLHGTRVVYSGTLGSVDRIRADDTPLSEDCLCKPRTIYGLTKLNAESILLRYAKRFGFEWTILRLCTVYGPGYRPGGMFDKLAESLYRGTLPSRLAWPGRISLLYVSDAVDALIALGTTDAGRNTLYHISSGEAPTLDELITKIARVIGIKRRRISPLFLFWSLVRATVWLPGLMRLLPFRLRNVIWRMSLVVCDGLVAESTKFHNALPLQYTCLDEGLTATYLEAIESRNNKEQRTGKNPTKCKVEEEINRKQDHSS